jgi:hypothetical protein
MGRLTGSLVIVVVGLVAAGCAKKPFDGPTVDAFNGKLTADGKPVVFSPGENVILQVIHHDSGKQFGIPIKPDGTFQIGWMPIGKYSAMLRREPRAGGKGGPNIYNVPDGFSIQDGQTEYSIELGKGFKP